MDGEDVPANMPQSKQSRPHKKHSEFMLGDLFMKINDGVCIFVERPKKLRKLAGKLNVKKSLDYKAEQERRIEEPAYQPLLPPQDNGEQAYSIRSESNYHHTSLFLETILGEKSTRGNLKL